MGILVRKCRCALSLTLFYWFRGFGVQCQIDLYLTFHLVKVALKFNVLSLEYLRNSIMQEVVIW